jgi:hypothetical protein
MSEIEARLRDEHWLDLDHSDRFKEPVEDALTFFFERQEVPPAIAKRPIMDFLSDQIFLAIDDIPQRYPVFGVACLLAVYLPNFVLRALLSDPPNRSGSRRSERQDLITSFLSSSGEMSASISVTNFLGGYAEGYSHDREKNKAIGAAVESVLFDARFRALYYQWQLVNVRIKEDLARRFSDVAQDRSTERRDESLDLSARAEKLIDAIESGSWRAGLVGYSTGMALLRMVQSTVDRAYSTMSFAEAIAARGVEGFATGVAACVGVVFLICQAMMGGAFSLITNAYAQTTGSTQKFVPPVGLPLSVWVPMLIGFYVFLLAVLIVFLWKGYLASSKNQKAASFIDRFGTLALGVFLGKITGP